MKNIFFRTVVLAAVTTFCTERSLAAYHPGSVDTTGKLLIASQPHRGSGEMILKAANVVYPDILVGNEEQSIEYIESLAASKKNYLVNTFNRSKKLFPRVETILKKYNVPMEFKVLLAMESGFNGNAVSRAGAVGYWQIMDDVAKEYGLKIPQKVTSEIKQHSRRGGKTSIVKLIGIDERKNFYKSTIAAARYLQDRCRNLDNDWLLIAASYNCGIGNVWNAMQRCGKTAPTFWDIRQYLPAETRAYVMNFIALNVIFNNFDAFANNSLCFRDVTVKLVDLQENAADNAPPSMVE